MAIKIGHAVYDENGKSIGTKPGDQTGKEIRIDKWYKSGEESGKTWDYLLICTDHALAQKAADILASICTNDNYGYSQPNRWTGYSSIANHNGKIAEGKGDFDCSSLVLAAYILAGLEIPPVGYTGDMRKRLMDTGKFKDYSKKKYVSTDDYAEIGAIYLREGHHVCMALESKNNTEKTTIHVQAPQLAFPKYAGKSSSIVDALNSVGANSSYAYRKSIAAANGIKSYKGTSAQNLSMLKLLKNGKLLKP